MTMRPATGRAGAPLLVLLVAGLLGGCAGEGAGEGRVFSTETPRPLPAFAFKDAAGRSRTLADFVGHPVLLNVWAP